MSVKVAPCIRALFLEANTRAPGRSKASDGTVSSVTHRKQNPDSDHDPDAQGWVYAGDLTHDPAGGCDAHALADSLAERRDRRVKYLISRGRIWSTGRAAEGWRPYTGANPHDKHLHISVVPEHRADTSPWWAAQAPPDPIPEGDDMAVMVREKGKPTVWLTDLLTARRSVDSAAEVAALKAAGIRDAGEVPATVLAEVPVVAG